MSIARTASLVTPADRSTRRLYVVSMVFFGLSTATFDMFYNLFLEHVGISASRIGTILLVGFLAMAVTVIPLSISGDLAGLHPLMSISSLGFGACMLILPWPTSFLAHCLLFGLNSVFAAVMMAMTAAFLSSQSPTSDYFYDTTRQGLMGFLGSSAIVNVTAGVVSDHLGGPSTYRWMIFASGVLGMGIGLPRLMMRAHRTTQTPTELPTAARALGFTVSDLLKPMLVAFLIGGFSVLGIRFFNLVATGMFGLSITALGGLLTLERITSALCILLIGPVIKRVGSVTAVAVALLTVLPIQALGLAGGTVLAFMATYLIRQGVHYSQLSVLDLVTNIEAPPARRGLFNGAQRFGLFTGSAAASVVYGDLISSRSYTLAFALSGAMAAAAGLLYLAFYRNLIARPATLDAVAVANGRSGST